MAAHTKASVTLSDASSLSYGTSKFLRDIWTVLELKILFLLKGWYLYMVRPLVFPLAIFFWLRTVAPDDSDTVRRLLAGAIIFGFALSTVNMLSQQIILDRFSGRLKLLITMPMSKGAYAIGILAYATLQSAPIILLMLVLAAAAGVEFELTWAFFPLVLAVLFTLAGLTFVVSSYAPSQEAGGIMANLFGIALVVVSPVFFSMEDAPYVLKLLGWVSPMRYAADGVMKSLDGSTDVWMEFLVLTGFAVATMAVGLRKLRWREN